MNEQAGIPVSVGTESYKGRFFLVDPSLRGNGEVSGLEFANEDALIHPGMNIVERPTGEPDQYPERPHLVHVPENGGCRATLKCWQASGLSPRHSDRYSCV